MDTNNPLVSIIIPVYNAEKYIAETLRSALAQTWKNKEIIVVNDGSTDRSREVIGSFRSDEIILIDQPNQGASAAKQAGFERSKGEYIQYLDADDLLSANKIESQIRQLTGHPGYLGLCVTVHFKDGENPENSPIEHQWYAQGSNDPLDFLIKLYSGSHLGPFGGMIQPNAFLTPRTLIEKAGPWNISISPCADEDGEYFCRVILASSGIIYSIEAANYYRKFDTGGSLSGRKDKTSMANILRSIDLKYEHLKSRTESRLLNQVFAGHYWDVGVAAYPQFRDISDVAIKKAKVFGYNGQKYKAGKISTFASKILGWRVVRKLSYIKHGF